MPERIVSNIVNIVINRAPVLTLWAATVAERMGFARDEALSLGKAVAGLTAQAKGRQVPAVNTEDGVRAVVKDKAIEAGSVER